ncbi:MAG: peptide-methionine (R)-S-oxide reductase MsrB [Flavobacteriaceae bacterium]|nr:peptide-methionine (R)-S-oxide reductase MsrB [Flavobacteriaceae bacterium]MCY4216844.1 peptide-methionine (R)-S-oxide reductase MsrB [Flavobacteriaceae bacterium]MCY4253404.1 peptide-methionine (R)-S-oxide reductase MsrB [Flavobacteriaceae bacterium]
MKTNFHSIWRAILLVGITSFLCHGCINAQKQKSHKKESFYPISKTEVQWKAQLTPEAYDVLRRAGTERPFTGKYNDHKGEGTYHCAGCQAALYHSKHKFDSGTGWPSFDRGIEENLELGEDYLLGYRRVELKCSQCGGHLGHLFNDGPRETTGMRHCINSAALEFIPKPTDE